jgi:hypothetical protein
MKTVKKSKKSKVKTGSKKTEKLSKKQRRLAEREAKKAKRKGDGSFPNVLVVTKDKASSNGVSHFVGHGEDLSTLSEDGAVVAVYKLSRVSTISIKRKVALIRKS